MEGVAGGCITEYEGDWLDRRLAIGHWEEGLGPGCRKSRVSFVAADITGSNLNVKYGRWRLLFSQAGHLSSLRMAPYLCLWWPNSPPLCPPALSSEDASD